MPSLSHARQQLSDPSDIAASASSPPLVSCGRSLGADTAARMAVPTDNTHTNRTHAPLPSPNPIPLSAAQEAQVRDTYYRRVRDQCADEIKEFAECAIGRTFTAVWKCRRQRLAMNSCMIQHATAEEQDRAREEWFARRGERIKAKARREEKAKLQEEFHKHWWALDDKGNWGTDRPSQQQEKKS